MERRNATPFLKKRYMAKKIKVGDKVKWKSYARYSYGVVERIDNSGVDKPIKVRPKPEWKGQRTTLAALKVGKAIIVESFKQ